MCYRFKLDARRKAARARMVDAIGDRKTGRRSVACSRVVGDATRRERASASRHTRTGWIRPAVGEEISVVERSSLRGAALDFIGDATFYEHERINVTRADAIGDGKEIAGGNLRVRVPASRVSDDVTWHERVYARRLDATSDVRGNQRACKMAIEQCKILLCESENSKGRSTQSLPGVKRNRDYG
jgi:hypothetical protein